MQIKVHCNSLLFLFLRIHNNNITIINTKSKGTILNMILVQYKVLGNPNDGANLQLENLQQQAIDGCVKRGQ